MGTPVASVKITKMGTSGREQYPDLVAIEEPLELRLGYGPTQQREQLNVSVTMRTPGHDKELAVGFLFSEGIIEHINQINSLEYCPDVKPEEKENVLKIELQPDIPLDTRLLSKHFYTNSSCGVCGKTSIESLKTVIPKQPINTWQVKASVVCQLPALLQQAQKVFEHTGGLHACGLFNTNGQLLKLREDVGRHNAVDKLIGALLLEKNSANSHLLMLSGRISFELVQKAARAGINFIAAIGAPSSLAVQMAKKHQITMVGFVKNRSFNIYSEEHRIDSSHGICEDT